MKLQDKINTVKRSDNFEEKKFRMEATGKAFDILSNSLYSNKIRAIIRELSCNAYDSHKEAGKESTPFEIHLPTDLDRSFWIRDFGTGISENNIYEVYTTYFASTKSNTNEFVGCLGLGSKTPFSYTDNFTITSYFEGKKYVFSAFKSESGEPAIAKLAEEPSSEPAGLEIKLAVKERDFGEFIKEAAYVFKWFKHLPKFVGGKSPYIEPIAKISIGKTWYVERGASAPSAIMGNIKYPISLDNLSDKISKDTLKILEIINPTLEFPIGALEIAPSREHLQYEKRTIKAIEKRILDIKADIDKEIEESLAKCETKWDASLKLLEMSNGNFGKYINVIAKTIGLKWKDETVKTKYDFSEILGRKLEPGEDCFDTYYFSDSYHQGLTTKYNRLPKKEHEVDKSIIYIFVVEDGERDYSETKFRSWMRGYKEEYKHTNFIIISRTQDKKSEFDTIVKNLGLTKDKNYFYWHELSTISRSKGQIGISRRKKTESKILDFPTSEYAYLNKTQIWGNYESVDLELGSGFYVRRKNYDITDKNGNPLAHEKSQFILSAIKTLRNLNKNSIPKIHSFTATQAATIGDDWVDLEPYLYNKMKEMWTEKVRKEIFDCEKANETTSSIDLSRLIIVKEIANTKPVLKTKKYWETIIPYEKNRETNNTLKKETAQIKELVYYYNRSVPANEQLTVGTFPIDKTFPLNELNKIWQQYPILKLVVEKYPRYAYYQKDFVFSRDFPGWDNVIEFIEYKETEGDKK